MSQEESITMPQQFLHKPGFLPVSVLLHSRLSMVGNGQAGAGFECRGSSRKDLACITRTTTGIGQPVVLLSLVSDSPQAPVAQLSKWLELFAASARYSFGMGGTLGSSVARVTLAAIPQLGLKSTFSFADAGSPPEKFPS